MSDNSPFPGMDPYVEARHWWLGLHTQLIGKLSTDLLPPLLAPAYYVDAERSLQVLTNGALFPNIEIVRDVPAPEVRPAGSRLPVAEATLVITEADTQTGEENEESAIFIREAHTERLVTVIELLSYSNKTTGDEKRARYLPIPIQEAFEAVYRARRFRARLDYTRDPEGPLSEAHQAFIQTRLMAEGLRVG